MKIKAGIVLYRTRSSDLEVLLVRNNRGSWSIPKGRIEEGESRLKAARRELLEETGIEAPKTLSYVGRVWDEKQGSFLCFYLGLAPRYKRPRPGQEIVEAIFVPLSEAVDMVSRTQREILMLMRENSSSVA